MEEYFVRMGFFFETFWANSSGVFEGAHTVFGQISFLSSLSLSFSLSSSLFFFILSLLLSCFFSPLSSFIFFCLLVTPLPSSLLSLSCLLSLSLSVSPRDVVCGVVWCVSLWSWCCWWSWCVFVCCGTRKTWKNPCVDSKKRLRVSIRNVPVCTFETSSCVPAPRPHVVRGRFGWTHGVQGSSPVLLTRICPRMVTTSFRGSPKKLLDLSYFQV